MFPMIFLIIVIIVLNYVSMNILIINILSDIYIYIYIGMIMAIVNFTHIYIHWNFSNSSPIFVTFIL